MKNEQIIVTVYAADRPGIVRALSDAVLSSNGNWLESSLSRLCGQFAGIIHVSVQADKKTELLAKFDQLASDGIYITPQDAEFPSESITLSESLDIVVEANDRPGIIEEITRALADSNVNVEQMTTECESASMAGYELFRAHLRVTLPQSCSADELEQTLENVSDDLIVSIVSDD